MRKFIYILIIIFLFIAFTIFDYYRKDSYKVLKVNNALEIVVDLNGNKISDKNETICIPEIEALSIDFSRNNLKLAKNLNLTSEDALKMGYLTDTFAENFLTDKNVKLKFTGVSNQNCRFADIIINHDSYKETLLSSGYGIQNNTFSDKFKKNLEKAKNLKLVILNHKSNKYHKLDCEYGLAAHDIVIISETQLPKDSSPCKFCHVTKENINQYSKDVHNSYPLVISNGNVKMFLTDLTTKLKSDNKCDSLVCKELLSKINNAKESIDIAIYGWDEVSDILIALQNAKQRGVKIRVVYDNSKNSYYPETEQILALADDKSGDDIKYLMHNKFIIFDNKYVVTGSMNFSKTGLSGFNTNCIIFFDSHEISEIYKKEFEQMLNGKFHFAKGKTNIESIQIGKTRITPMFSPQDKIIKNSIIPLINDAKSYIYIPAFIITHNDFANSLIDAHKRGVDVKIIIDATNSSAAKSKVKILRNANIPVKIENYAGKIHSKSIIIDDKYIVAGSMNFTNSGENKNDENSIIIEDDRLAIYYKRFFEYLWNKIPDKYLKMNPNPESINSIGSCSDGIDNDYDGKIDLQDEGCINKNK